MTKRLFYRILALAFLILIVGSVVVVQANNYPIAKAQAAPSTFFQYLPFISGSFNCPNYFDGFSNPSSGWFVGEDNKYLSEYLNGEYHVLIKRTNSSYFFDAPACKRSDYIVEVDARWAGSSNQGTSYGLMLGKMENPTQLYLFEVEADVRKFTISHYGQGGWDYIIQSQFSGAINAGTATNHLKVTHDGNWFTAEVNETEVNTWEDTTESGEKGLGLFVLSYPTQGNADARFDNFRVTNISQ